LSALRIARDFAGGEQMLLERGLNMHNELMQASRIIGLHLIAGNIVNSQVFVSLGGMLLSE